MATWRDRLGELQETVESRTGRVVVEKDKLDLLEAVQKDHRAMQKELDLLGWNVLEYMGGQPHEVNIQSRRKFARQARTVWVNDPIVGGTIALRNNYIFGRGVPVPRAKDPAVQDVIDEAFADDDNQAVLTGFSAQLALGVDLELQANLFFTAFADGDDGKVKLSLLDHDTVVDVVKDPENRLRVLYYVCQEARREWDYKTDQPKYDPRQSKTVYYRHWRNEEPPPPELKDKLGEGAVFHVAVNRTSEQVFGTPSMRRTIRWVSALNDYLAARVDVMQAAAAFVMKRKVKGSPSQVQKLAAQAISRESPLASGEQVPPQSGAILTENQSVEHVPFNVNTGAGNATQDIQMLRSQLSVASGFPQHYLGDSSSTSLGTATALEGPVLKNIEAYQEIFEQVFRWFTDLAISRAVETGRLSKTVAGEPGTPAPGDTGEFGPNGDPNILEAELGPDYSRAEGEAETERDLSYDFSMPNPLRRSMGDLVNSVATIAKTFDPNATNMELSRSLLGIALGEGLEVQEPGRMVDVIFPEGYVDPAIAAMQQRQGPPEGDPTATGGDPTAVNADNPYGGPQQGQSPDGKGGLGEGRFEHTLDDLARSDTQSRIQEFDDEFKQQVESALLNELTQLAGFDPADHLEPEPER